MSQKKEDVTRRKLIDGIVPRPEDGPLIGFIATSYEFQPDFFETDFLPSLMGLGAWDDRSWASRIAVERALAGMEAASVFVDARRYRGRPQSFRVSVQPVVAAPGAAFHPKVVLLVHDDVIRLTVGSANLTEPGYRKNREVVSVLRASAKQPGAGALLRSAVEGMRSALGSRWTDGAERIAAIALERIRSWGDAPEPESEAFVWGGSGPPLWRTFLEWWPAGEPIEAVTIVSPFWSEEEGQGPVSMLLGALAERRLLASGASLRLLTEARPIAQGEYRPVLPASFGSVDLSAFGVCATAHAVDPTVLPEEVEYQEGFVAARALHAKVALFEGKRHALAYVGSANFSSHGWGFLHADGRGANMEAGLIVLRSGRDRASLAALIPETIGPPVELSGAAAARLALPDTSDDAGPWPSFVKDIVLVPSSTKAERLDLEVAVFPEEVSGTWRIALPGGDATDSSPLLSSGRAGSQSPVRVGLEPAVLEQLLRDKEVVVRWWACEEGVRFPVNVSLAARHELPIAPGAARPGERLLLAYYQGKISWEDLYPDDPLDLAGAGASPVAAEAQGVDTSRIQSYQIREFVEALRGIQDDLRAASSSGPTMRLAVLGPVSPLALARHVRDAVRAGQRSPTAGGFQLFEIICCLKAARAVPVEARHEHEWRAHLDRALFEIEGMLVDLQTTHAGFFPAEGPFRRYEAALSTFHGAAKERT